jgi:hypothetical protein
LKPWPRRLGAGAALLCIAGGAFAAGSTAWGVSAGLQQRRLEERADDGTRILRESGTMLRLQADGQWALPGGGALRGEAGLSAAPLDYRGRTQAGAPLATTSTHRDLDATLLWRPLPPARWGEGWLVLQALQQRRQIASTAAASGLRETSTLWLAGLRWTGHFSAAGWQWQPWAEARASLRHRLAIDYGGAYDASSLTGGTRRSFVLGLAASQEGSPWQWSVQWTGARQSASAWQSLERGGLPAGRVRQPRIAIDDVAVLLRRAF